MQDDINKQLTVIPTFVSYLQMHLNLSVSRSLQFTRSPLEVLYVVYACACEYLDEYAMGKSFREDVLVWEF